MRAWLSVLSWYTLIVGALSVLSAPFMIGKAVTYEAGGVAIMILFSAPIFALGVLGLVARSR